MPQKPTYKELEQRVRNLERFESEMKQIESALKEANNTLQQMLDGTGDIIGFQKPDHTILRYNRAGYESLGLKPEEVIGKKCYELIGREKECEECATRKALKSKKLETVEKYYAKIDKYLKMTANPVLNDNGEIAYIIEQLTDITERKQMEQALENRMISLTRPIDDPEGITFNDLFNIDDIQSLQDKFADATGVASIITNTDGTPITKPSNFCRLCSDIIRKTEKGLQNCYKSDAVIGRQNPDGPTIQPCLSGGLWDAGAAISVGGKHIANWLIGQVRDETQTDEEMRAYAREIGADEEAVIKAFHEVPSMSSDKFKVISETLFSLASQLSSTVYQNTQQARFISEKKRADEEKERLEAQLRQAQKMEAVGRLAGGVAHDFNNMLSVILLNTEMALDDVEPVQDLYTYLAEIRNAAKRSADVTSQLLAFARKQTISPEVLNLNDIIQHALNMLERLIGEDIDLIFVPDKYAWPILIDPSQVDQILANLCVNARDAITGIGKLTIETHNVNFDEEYCDEHTGFIPGDFVMLAVSDNGNGMDKETLDSLFEPFFTTKGLEKGTGLGLATVYGIVKQNNGFINVYSELGRGSTFKIYLPRHMGSAETHIEKKSVQRDVHGSETILLVEDEPSILRTSKMMLERFGYSVLAVTTPMEATRLAREYEGDIDLLMTDVILPKINGKDLAEIILTIYPDIKCLFMSGYTADVIAHHGVLEEGVNFIQKPFSKQTLSAKLREILG